jgi:hypothetical protein
MARIKSSVRDATSWRQRKRLPHAGCITIARVETGHISFRGDGARPELLSWRQRNLLPRAGARGKGTIPERSQKGNIDVAGIARIYCYCCAFALALGRRSRAVALGSGEMVLAVELLAAATPSGVCTLRCRCSKKSMSFK